MSDDWRSGYRPVSDESYRQPSADPPNQRGGLGRDYGNGNGRGGASGNGRGYSRGGNGAAPSNGNGAYPSGGRGGERNGNGARGDRSVPGGRRVASGRHGGGPAGPDSGAAGDDTGAWYRPGRYNSARTGARQSVRPGSYGPVDRTGFGGRTARVGAVGPYGPGGSGAGPGGPGGPGGGRRGPRRGARDMRALIDPDGQTPLPLKILRRLWYGRWWRHWSFKKVGLLFGGLCATMALVLVATFFVVLNSTKVPISALETAGANSSSVVYYSNGHVVGCFCTAGRFPLTEDQVKKSKHLVDAVLAAEDRSFFSEGGISIPGLLRAVKNDLSGGSIQGGSTITEQFVKTYYDRSGIGNLSYSKKIKEIFVAIKLAKMEPKWWILTHYLNAIPLGSGANGVEAAAQTYFHRHAWKLTVAQAAMIASMIQLPSSYDPENPRAIVPIVGNSLLQRWIYVLTNMLRDGAITQAQFNGLVPDPTNTNSTANLKKFPKLTPSSIAAAWHGYRGYIMQLVANELAANYHLNYSTTQLGNLGLQIHTTINERLMNALYAAVEQEKQNMASLGVRMPSYVHISAVLEKPGTGQILAFYGGPGYGAKHCKRLNCKFDTILAGEPVGSSFKPYVLTTAIFQGMDVRKSVLNSHSPLCIPPDFPPYRYQLSKQTTRCNTPVGYWQFNESSENFKQNLNPWEATAVSNDPAFEDLIHRTGVQNVINMAQTLGVSSSTVNGLNALFGDGCPKIKHDPNCHPGAVNAALGEGDLTAVDQANTFSVLVSGGKLVTPHLIKSVTRDGVPLQNPLVLHKHVIPYAVAADTDYGLSFDTSFTPAGPGTGVPNAQWNRPMIAKTGTLGSGAVSSQAWFIGAIPQYSMSVGMFTDKPNTNPPEILDVLPSIGGWLGGFGGAWPATIWHHFMSDQFSQLPVKQLPTPSYTGSNPTFVKWVLALPPKKKHKRCQILPGGGGGQGGGGNGGGGGGNGGGGNGHHHIMVALDGGPKQCQGGGPGPKTSPPPTFSPSPSPTITITPLPTPTTTSPGPSNSPSPSPSTTTPFVASHRQRVPGYKLSAASLSPLAIVPDRLVARPASVVPSGRI